jgi:hypothetical protein
MTIKPYPPPPQVCVILDGYYSHTWKFVSFVLKRQKNYRERRVGKDMAGDCLCLFQRSIVGKTSENHENLSQDNSWVRVPIRVISVGRKLNTIEKRRQDQSFGEEITGSKATTPNNCLTFDFQ